MVPENTCDIDSRGPTAGVSYPIETLPDQPPKLLLCIPWVLALIRLSRPRTWIFAMSMWLVAYVSTGAARPALAVTGLVICAALTAATNLLNIYTDQAEDQINLPQRHRLVEQAGYLRLKMTIAFCYFLPLLLAATLTNPTHALVCFVGALDSIFYSWGVRFKQYMLLSLASISGVIILPFLAGWSMAQPLDKVDPIVVVLGFSFFAYANLKNLPDAAGDQQRGVRTIFIMYELERSRSTVLVLMLSPYGLLALLVMLGVLAPTYLLTFAMIPILLVILDQIPRARTRNEKEGVHTLGYLYQILFYLIALTVYNPTLLTILCLALLLIVSMLVEYLGIDSRSYDRRLVISLGSHTDGQP